MENETLKPIVVPHTELSADLLQAVIESFVLREGTDYGEKEFSLEDKVARVFAQLKRGEARIIFDPESDSVTIVVR
ncbi:MAG TPA: YheU family protein [Steroidobacteraceae bacterium]|nr:YheU family protein [Steroidobacteraceae bacterium]